MRGTKRGRGHPPGERFPRRLPFYDDDEGMGLLREMARQDGCSAAALMRRLIRHEAAVRGVEPPTIVRDPRRCAGDPILAGTRTAVHDVVSYAQLHHGNLEEVRAELPHLSPEQIRAALTWYEEHREEIEEILRRRREDYERLPLAPVRR